MLSVYLNVTPSWVSKQVAPDFQGFPLAMPETRTSQLRPEPSVAPNRPGIPPLVPVLAPLVVAAIVIAFVFSRYLPALSPVQPAPVAHFADVTAESGITFSHDNGSRSDVLSPTTLGSGVAVIDYDGDGAPDLFFVNGGPWPWIDNFPERQSTCQLYRNDGHGHFRDVTARAGVGLKLQGMGVAVGDYDNDGHPDLFITALGQNHLLHNRGDGTFEDVSERAGVGGDDHVWSTGALWLDIDGDGKLDLIVCRYARWLPEVELETAFKIARVGRSYGSPAGFGSVSPVVYRNLGDGKFVEVTEAVGLANLAPETRLPRSEPVGVAALDANGDGKLDLLFFYHSGEPTLFLNGGDGHFHEAVRSEERREGVAGLIALNALPADPRSRRGTLIDALQSLGSPIVSAASASLPEKMGFAFFDYDLDGRIDIFSAEGRIEPELNRFDQNRDFGRPPVLLWNRGDGWFPAPHPAEGFWTVPLLARGVVTADLDGDGDLDVVLTQNGGPAKILKNEQRSGAAWLRIQLVATRGARDGSGARVEVHTPRRTLIALAAPAMGYLSQSENVLTFGLGEDARVRKVTVIWPSGDRQEIISPSINQRLVIKEP